MSRELANLYSLFIVNRVLIFFISVTFKLPLSKFTKYFYFLLFNSNFIWDLNVFWEVPYNVSELFTVNADIVFYVPTQRVTTSSNG